MKERDDIEKFLPIIFKLYQSSLKEKVLPIKVHDESKKPGKRMVSSFEVDCAQAREPFYLDDPEVVPTLHAGDATGNSPHYLGVSMARGADRCYTLT
jgi:hypothetical protein